jgi:hypothetical protein
VHAEAAGVRKDQVLDSLYVIEMAMRHFLIRAEMGKNAGRKKEEVDEDYEQAAALLRRWWRRIGMHG